MRANLRDQLAGTRLRSVAAVLLLVLAPSICEAHGKSKSIAEWIFRARSADLRINFAGHDLAASVPNIDADADKQLSPVELEAMRAVVGRRTVEHTVFTATGEGAPVACQPDDPVVRGLGDPVVTEIEVRAVWRCDGAISKVHVELRQLPELEPPHITVGTFLAGKTTAQHIFTTVAPAFDLDVELPSLAEELGGTAIQGVRSMISPAALLFLLGLLLFERPKRAMLLFAIFVAMILGAGVAFPLSPPPPWYAFVFALGVAWTGIEMLAKRKSPIPKLVLGAIFSAWFAAVMAPKVDVPNRLAFALGETAVALVALALCSVLATVLGDRVGDYRRPVGIAWLCGAGALTALAVIS